MAEKRKSDRHMPAIVSGTELSSFSASSGVMGKAGRVDFGQPRSGAENKLSVMPLTSLLPGLGDLSQLPRFVAHFEQRLEQIQGARGSFPDEDSSEEARNTSEESMLAQVMQWLSAGKRE